jgi:hypothetical protein
LGALIEPSLTVGLVPPPGQAEQQTITPLPRNEPLNRPEGEAVKCVVKYIKAGPTNKLASPHEVTDRSSAVSG